MKTYKCLQCDVEVIYGPSKKNKYCSNRCQQDWQWHNVVVPRIEAGLSTADSTTTLKRYLCEVVGEKCAECNLEPIWNEKPLALHLDHKDGNSDNNHPSNLRLLCPNCHTQTPNFGSKGKGSRYHKMTKRNKYIRQYRGKPD